MVLQYKSNVNLIAALLFIPYSILFEEMANIYSLKMWRFKCMMFSYLLQFMAE